jgi:hypothetical protein
VAIAFRSADTLCPLSVRDVLSLEDERSVRFGASKVLEVDSYTVE